MTRKKTPTQAPHSDAGTAISHCQITMEPLAVNEHMASAVRALAEACAANARALEEAAKRLAGPPDHRTGISVSGAS
jgi:hypothetical protein